MDFDSLVQAEVTRQLPTLVNDVLGQLAEKDSYYKSVVSQILAQTGSNPICCEYSDILRRLNRLQNQITCGWNKLRNKHLSHEHIGPHMASIIEQRAYDIGCLEQDAVILTRSLWDRRPCGHCIACRSSMGNWVVEPPIDPETLSLVNIFKNLLRNNDGRSKPESGSELREERREVGDPEGCVGSGGETGGRRKEE